MRHPVDVAADDNDAVDIAAVVVVVVGEAAGACFGGGARGSSSTWTRLLKARLVQRTRYGINVCELCVVEYAVWSLVLSMPLQWCVGLGRS